MLGIRSGGILLFPALAAFAFDSFRSEILAKAYSKSLSVRLRLCAPVPSRAISFDSRPSSPCSRQRVLENLGARLVRAALRLFDIVCASSHRTKCAWSAWISVHKDPVHERAVLLTYLDSPALLADTSTLATLSTAQHNSPRLVTSSGWPRLTERAVSAQLQLHPQAL